MTTATVLRLAVSAVWLLAGGVNAEDADQANTAVAASDWSIHLAGYTDVTYIDGQSSDPSGTLTLNPIVHALWRDRFLIEAEVENAASDDGERETALEYATLSWLANDHVALVVGKFLSPVGYFFQNIHPSWMNKLPSVPVGFGHGGAAPLTDLGAQLRGGWNLKSGTHLNYAFYLANGPRLGREEDALDVIAEGSRRNDDGRRVGGGRLGWMPVPTLEIGVSAARGAVQLEAMAPEDGAPIATMQDVIEPRRDYRVEGADLAWRAAPTVEVRAEWIRQRVDAAATSAVPQAATWRAWYAQCSYRFGRDRWEAVARLGDSTSPHEESTFQQAALGLNYLFSPQTQFKLAWENNRSDFEVAAADRLLLQIAHGF